MSENEALQSDKLREKINEIQQNLENITRDFTVKTDEQKNEGAKKLQSLYRGKKAREETEELKDCKTKFEELEKFDGDNDDEFETKLDDLYKKCKFRLELDPKKMRKEYVEKNKCNKATTFEGIKKINYYDKVNKKNIRCENVAQEKYKELEKKRDEEEKRDIEERLQKQRKAKAAKAAEEEARKAEATKCQKKINELVGIYDSIQKETLDISKDGEKIYKMFQLIIEIYDSRTFDNLETPGENSVCTTTKLRENKDQLETIIKLLKTIELFQDEKYVTDRDKTYEVIIKNSLKTKGMDKEIVYNVELKDIANKKTETIRLLDLKFDTKTYKKVSEGMIKSALDQVERQNLDKQEAAIKIQSIMRRRIAQQEAFERKKKFNEKKRKELESELEKKQQPVNCGIFAGPAACENEKGTDGLRKCEYEQPGGPCKEIEGEQRRKFLTYQYNEEQEIKGKGWVKFDELEQDKSYLPVWNIEDKKEIRNWNTDNAIYVFEDGYYFDGEYNMKKVIKNLHNRELFKIKINNKKINVKNILFDLLEKNLSERAQKKFAEEANKAKDAVINKGVIATNTDPIEQATEVDNNKLKKLEKQLEETKKNLREKIAESEEHAKSNNEKIKKLKEQQQQELQKKLDEQSEKYEKELQERAKEAETEKGELEQKKKEYEQKAKEAEKNATKSEQKIERLNKQIKNLSEEDVKKKAQLEAEKKKSEEEQAVVEQRKKELHKEQIEIERLKSQHEQELKELKEERKKAEDREEEKRRKKMKEFMKHKGESLKESIESLKDKKENFTNMSEIKIAALESYPTLHDKIKKFLVFKEDELIKAHHAKFYSDNIKRNNEKLVETLKLVPNEPFLGIEGLPLVSGFGSNPEKPKEEKKEEVITLKVVKEGVRKFIMSKAEHIFNPSQHQQLSVKEYLKTL